MNPASLANLKPYEAGQTGNAAGRPKGSGFGALTRRLREVLGDGDNEKARDLVDQLITLAGKGNGAAIREIFNRLDGPLTQRVEVSDAAVFVAFARAMKDEGLDEATATRIIDRACSEIDPRWESETKQ